MKMCKARRPDEALNASEAIVIHSRVCMAKSQTISDLQSRSSNMKISQSKSLSKVTEVVQSQCSTSITSLLVGLIRIIQVIVLALTVTPNASINGSRSRGVVAAQDVDLNLPLETPLGISGDDNDQVAPQTRLSRSKVKNLDEFLENLAILSVGQKHQAKFDCELSSELETFKLIWLRLSRAAEQDPRAPQHDADVNNKTQGNSDDIMLISLNQKIITPDKRFKVHRLSALRWILSIDNVNANDGEAYYLCQVSSTSFTPDNSPNNASVKPENLGSWFVGGARLHVLVPPKIVEIETSPSQVQANEFEDLVLRCKVTSEPQAQLMWKREDGQSLDEMDVEQKFKHEIKRENAIIKTTTLKSYSRIISIDSSELVFKPFRRHHAAAYLCIASNGVQPGVSQRVSVLAVNCRTNSLKSAPNESCDSESSLRTRTAYPEDASDELISTKVLSTTTVASTDTNPTTSRRRKVWTSKSSNSSQSTNSKLELQRRLLADQQRADKRRTGNSNTNRNRNDLLANQVSIKGGNNIGSIGSSNSNNNNNDSHFRWQQEAPSNKANGSFKHSQTTTSRALISLLFAFIPAIQLLSFFFDT